jgi:moderate conductance mechanosensitive channel
MTTYIASATVIGLAVSFGSQGVVQDVISGLTIMIADIVDVGDMVDVGGQVGIVRRVGIRYLTLVNFQGATVNIPNRNVANVVNFRAGYVRAYLDLRPPGEGGIDPAVVGALRAAADGAWRQFSGAMLLPPSVVALPARDDRPALLRVKFRIWPGQTAIIEGPVRQSLLAIMRQADAGYPDWAAALHYRAEPEGAKAPLPRPAAVEARLRVRGERRRSPPPPAPAGS